MTTTPQKIQIGHKDGDASINIEIREKGENFLAFVKEIAGGVAQPVRIGYLDFIGGETPFMTVRAPIRKKDEEGNFITRAREKDGKFLDEKGKEVAGEAEAAREYVYLTQKDDDSKQVYAQIATLNVKNTKGDGSPTVMTLISAKFFNDDEALAAERLSFKMGKLGKDHPEYSAVQEELKTLRRESGTWHNFFINEGAEILRDKGFEVRVKDKDNAPSPSP